MDFYDPTDLDSVLVLRVVLYKSRSWEGLNLPTIRQYLELEALEPLYFS